jgi:hypothetical protein
LILAAEAGKKRYFKINLVGVIASLIISFTIFIYPSIFLLYAFGEHYDNLCVIVAIISIIIIIIAPPSIAHIFIKAKYETIFLRKQYIATALDNAIRFLKTTNNDIDKYFDKLDESIKKRNELSVKMKKWWPFGKNRFTYIKYDASVQAYTWIISKDEIVEN